jgi:HK97 family phage major capsid protein
MADSIVELRAKRDAVLSKLDALVEAAKVEARSLSTDEAGDFTKLSGKAQKLTARITELEAEEKRANAAAAAAADPAAAAGVPEVRGNVVVRSETMTYDRHTGNSWAKDLAYLSAASKDAAFSARAAGARERLAQHAKELEIEYRNSSRDERRKFDDFIETRGGSTMETRVNPNTTFGTGGEFVPPLWLVSQFAAYKRPTRTFANRCVNMALPPGIDIINIPKITTGSLTGVQTAQGGAIPSQDIVTTTVAASVRTIAGQEDISLQLLEQSPLSMDQVIFQDLSRDYDLQLDTQILTGSNANGQHLGILSIPSATVANNTKNSTSTSQIPVTSTTFLDASTTATQYRAVVNGVNQVESLYFDAPTAIWVHPRRANSWAYAADTTARPLFTPAKYGQYNQVGTNEVSPQAQGIAGELYGLPVIKDANMPTACNGFTGTALNLTGSTQDPVVVLDESQMWLWEGPLRMRALPEVLSGTLQIRYQVYAYSAFMGHRFPTAISVLAGAGLAAPGF